MLVFVESCFLKIMVNQARRLLFLYFSSLMKVGNLGPLITFLFIRFLKNFKRLSIGNSALQINTH